MMDKPLLPDPEPIITETPGAPTGRIKYWLLNSTKYLHVTNMYRYDVTNMYRYDQILASTLNKILTCNKHIQV